VQQGPVESVLANKQFDKLAAQPPPVTARPELGLSDETLQELGMLESSKDEGSRRTGDWKVYTYYAKIAGRWNMILYLLACAAFVFGVTVPRRLSCPSLGNPIMVLIIGVFSNMGAMVDQCQRSSSK
jgi:ATP-binding cassette, subfamily C (CFTR/MRP), member 1